MTLFILGCLLFFIPHSLQIVYPQLRAAVVARYNPHLWQAGYSLVSIVGLVLLIKGYGELRFSSPLWYVPPVWMRHVTGVLMLPVFVLIIATYFPGKIKQRLHHPMLIATIIWGVAHLFSNGRVIDVLLFGIFALWAAMDLISTAWRAPSHEIRHAPQKPWNDAIAVIGGLAIYGLLVWRAHQWITGIALL